MVEPTTIVVFGTGSMAMLFGARLARAGHSVTLAGRWRQGLRAVQRDGVRVVEPGSGGGSGGGSGDGTGAVTWGAALRTRDLGVPFSRAEEEPASLALVLVKSNQSGAIGRRLGDFLGPSGTALSLQNGLGNRELLEQGAGRTVALGVTTAAANVVAPGRVEEVSTGRTVLPVEKEEVARLLSAAGFNTVTSRDIRPHTWLKLAINCAINPVTALEGVPNGALLERSAVRRVAMAAAAEVGSVAVALGVRLPADPMQEVLRVAEQTAANVSSMLQDIRRGALTEIDALSGSVVERGLPVGVATPVNEELWRRVRQLEEAVLPAADLAESGA